MRYAPASLLAAMAKGEGRVADFRLGGKKRRPNMRFSMREPGAPAGPPSRKNEVGWPKPPRRRPSSSRPSRQAGTTVIASRRYSHFRKPRGGFRRGAGLLAGGAGL